jgi:hypothetical protein
MLLEAAVVVVFAAFSCMVKFWMVIQSPPVILNIASVNAPLVSPVAAVIVLELP